MLSSLPTAQAVQEDAALLFSVVGGNAIQIDVATDQGVPQSITISTEDGALSISITDGLTIDGLGTNAITLVGAVADLNAALDGLSYVGPANAFGARTLTIASEGAIDTVAVAIAAVNDAPIVAELDGDMGTFMEGQALVRLDADDAATVTDVDQYGYRVQLVGSGLAAGGPVFIAPVPDGTGRVFVVEQRGSIRILDPQTHQFASTPFLDLAGTIPTNAENGLLGFATAPDFSTSGKFYVYLANSVGDLEIRSYTTLPGNSEQADPGSMDVILEISHPGSDSHNGGWLGFGPDNNLYLATGDEGRVAPNFTLSSNAQDPNSLLGKILRIDVSNDAFPDDPLRDYAIPGSNPFASDGGAPEIFALGLRNPFRASFDPVTNNFYIGDVGESAREEINLLPADMPGLNFGWAVREGTVAALGEDSPAFTPPVAEYVNRLAGPVGGIGVTGGYVYRGPIEELQGQYIFADLRGNIWSLPVADMVQGQTIPSSSFNLLRSAFAPNQGSIFFITSFGIDETNNLYLTDWADGEVYRIEDSATPNFNGGAMTVAITSGGVPAQDQLLLELGASTGISLSNGTNWNSQVRMDGVLIGAIGFNGSGRNGQPLVVHFSSDATAATVQRLTRSLSYTNSNVENPTPGDRTIAITIRDGAGASGNGVDQMMATVTVSVAAIEDPGDARDDAFAIAETATINNNLFSDNGFGADADPDDMLAVSEVQGMASAVGAQIVLSSGALLTVQADGSFAYDPNGAFDYLADPTSGASNTQAVDTFSYALADGELAEARILLTGLDSADGLVGTSGGDSMNGGLGNDFLHGLSGDDQLSGGEGEDQLNGGTGADRMTGGDGDDTYIIDDLEDLILENPGEGADRAYTLVDYRIRSTSEIETLVASATAGAINLTGNALANNLFGNEAANVLMAYGGADYLFGGDGGDVLFGGEGADFIDAGSADDFLFGGDGDDVLIGGAGRDYLDGGAGTNRLYGGANDDTYVVDNPLLFISEVAGEGFDLVYTSIDFRLSFGSEIEVLQASNQASTTPLVLGGNEFANLLIGNSGDNNLTGLGGHDQLRGFGGADGLFGGAGDDSIDAGDGADFLFGEAGSDAMSGGRGVDFLDGGAGADFMNGGDDGDFFLVDNVADTIVEAEGGGSDVVYTTIDYRLTAGAYVEILSAGSFAGTASLRLTGNELSNVLWGNAGQNVLNGGGSADQLTGFSGADSFLFADLLDSSNIDTITDFAPGVDRIVLDSAIFASLSAGVLGEDDFAFRIGGQATTAISFDRATGSLFYDSDGDGAGLAQEFARVGVGLNLSASDFFVI